MPEERELGMDERVADIFGEDYMEQLQQVREYESSLDEEGSRLATVKKKHQELTEEIHSYVYAQQSLFDNLHSNLSNPDLKMTEKMRNIYARLRGYTSAEAMGLSSGIETILLQFVAYKGMLEEEEKDLEVKLEVAENYIINSADRVQELVAMQRESLEDVKIAQAEMEEVNKALEEEKLAPERRAELTKESLGKEKIYEELSSRLGVISYEINLHDNVLKAVQAYSRNVRDILIETREMEEYIASTYKQINTLTKMVIRSLQMAELQVKGLELYEVVKSMTNAAMIISAELSANVTKERPKVMDGKFVRDTTIGILEDLHEEAVRTRDGNRADILSQALKIADELNLEERAGGSGDTPSE